MTELTIEKAQDLLRIIEALEDELAEARVGDYGAKQPLRKPPAGVNLREMKLWLERAVFLGTKTGAP